MYSLKRRCLKLFPAASGLIQGFTSNVMDAPRSAFLDVQGRIVAVFDQAKVTDEEVIILQVVEETQSDYILDMEGTILARQKGIANRNIEQLRELGALQGVTAQGTVHELGKLRLLTGQRVNSPGGHHLA